MDCKIEGRVKKVFTSMNDWYKNAVIYQIYPQSFKDSNGDGVGDIPGIIEKLDYLKFLGVDAIWICPMYDSPNHDNGYDVKDYYHFQKKYGSLEDFNHLIQESHKREIKVIMDLVINHTSFEHPWFLESSKSKDNPKSDWYIWKDSKEDGSMPTNWQAIFGGPSWSYCASRKQYYFHTFSPYQPDLNWECKQMKEAIFEMVNWWIDHGVDGFRLDAINFIAKEEFVDGKVESGALANIYPFVANKPKVHSYLEELKENCFVANSIMTVGEASSAQVEDALNFAKELDMIFQFEHLTIDIDPTVPWATRNINLIELKSVMEKWQTKLHEQSWNALFWENHDQPRIVTRLGEEGVYREKSAKMLAMSLYFMEGTPFIFQGQELGCVNTQFNKTSEVRDIEVKNAFKEFVDTGKYSEEEFLERISRRSRDTSRTPMPWNSKKYAGFSTCEPWIKVNDRYSEINVLEQMSREDSCLNFYRELLFLRKKMTVVSNGRFELIDKYNPKVFAYSRENQDEKILIICNYSSEQLVFPYSLSGEERIILRNDRNSTYLKNQILNPYEGIVLKIK